MTRNTCEHCGDRFATYTCPTCGILPPRQCGDCHDEIAHGIVCDSNLHFVGSRDSTHDEPSPGWENAVRIVEDQGNPAIARRH